LHRFVLWKFGTCFLGTCFQRTPKGLLILIPLEDEGPEESRY
jgi:hypothetical protein